MWDKQAQSADQKQAELFHIQWNLIREQMSTFARESVQIRNEVQNFKEEVKTAFDRERDARDAGEKSLRAHCEELKKADMDLHEQLKSVSDLVAKEAQERIAGDEESSRALLQAKQAIEKETRDRGAAHSEILNRLKEVSTALEEERRERENADRNTLAENRKEIEAERIERRDEVSALKQALRTVDSTISSGLKSLRAALEQEEAERKEEFRSLTHNLSNLQNQHDVAARNVEQKCAELHDRLRSLSDAIGIEATERKECDAEIERGLRDLSGAIDREARQWSQALKGVQDMIKSEAVEREAGDEAVAKSVKASVQKVEIIIDKVREALWGKMVSLADHFFEFSREWREAPPTLDSSQIAVGHITSLPALREGRLATHG